MDDISLVSDFVGVVPVDTYQNCSETSDVKFTLFRVKVCVSNVYNLLLLWHKNSSWME